MTAKATIAGAISESELQAAVIELARLRGWRVTHFRPARVNDTKWATPIQGDPGFVDLVLARAGDVLFVELKSEKGKLSQDQELWRQALVSWAPDDSETGASIHAEPHAESCLTYQVWRPSQWQDETIARFLE